jgi:hypothetical protein
MFSSMLYEMHNGEMPVYNNVQRTNDMSHAMLSPINRILKRENNIATITKSITLHNTVLL